MSWSNHPEQAGSGTPVPILDQRQGALASLAIDPQLPDLPTLHTFPDQAAPKLPLLFSVRYALLEYVSFMWQHGGYLIRRRRIGPLATFYMLSKSTAAAAMHFIALGRSRHTYEFTVDEHGIVRVGPGGVTLIPWSDVNTIRTYTRGFLMVLKRGTLPIPYRCLSDEQARAMARLEAARREGSLG